ncbi:MAG: DUF47 family protein [Methanoregula sp.]|jgi:hypothetical protein|uniref:DUF47 domain-containing protein n=1 Tax=Methanoregula sp. TaxID=2052170 RepID=UPI0025ED5653|nr:DUF47 family protein [Methanoregula sp.]MCK9632514.1 DUF47 family protein [Methanoregula sp.]
MNKKKWTPESGEKRGLFASIFPREYDFECMLAVQSDRTTAGVQAFVDWLNITPLTSPDGLERIENEVDTMRHDMEYKLIQSFSTPFDRQDIYSISRQMDYIINFSKETAKEMQAFSVAPDRYIHDMARQLLAGTECIGRGIKSLGSDKDRVEDEIRHARYAYNTLEEIYIAGMAEILKTDDAMNAIRTREIYHHLRDAGRAMRDTLDILHNAVIDLA